MNKLNVLLFCAIFNLFFFAAGVSAQKGKPLSYGALNRTAVSLPMPEFPAAAKAVRASGVVNVAVTVDEKGFVVEAEAVSGHPLLRSAAEKAARAAVFPPKLLNGEPVKVWGVIVYNFAAGKTASVAKAGKTASDKDEIKDVLNGQAVKLPSPEYPPAARAVRAAGKVKIEVTLDEQGNVASAIAISGHPLLRQSALEAAEAAKFDAAQIKNKSVKTRGILVYNFPILPKEKENRR